MTVPTQAKPVKQEALKQIIKETIPPVPQKSLKKLLDEYDNHLGELDTFRREVDPRPSDARLFSLSSKKKKATASVDPLLTFKVKYEDWKQQIKINSGDRDVRKHLSAFLVTAELLYDLQKSVQLNKPKHKTDDDSFYLAGIELWKKSVQAAQQLCNNYEIRGKYSIGPYLGNPGDHSGYDALDCLNHALHYTSAALAKPSYESANALQKAAENLKSSLQAPSGNQGGMSPFWKGMLSALLAVAGLAMYVGGIMLACSIASTGMGLAVGVPLAVVGAALLVGGFINLLNTFDPAPSSEKAYQRRELKDWQKTARDVSVDAANTMVTLVTNNRSTLFSKHSVDLTANTPKRENSISRLAPAP